jgi:hypothetical protein
MDMPFEKRLSNWPRLLADFIESRRNVPFAWGTNDCCTFAADALMAIHGDDPMKHLRGTYADAPGAFEIIGTADDLPNVAGEILADCGFREVEPAFAGRGDPVCVMLERPTCGVHLGNLIAAPGEQGLVFLPPREIVKAWRAG